jgi:seryl-tRNA synthetase
MEALTDVAKAAENDRDKALFGIGNLVHDSVPDFQDEVNNEEVEKWGDEFVVTMETHKYHHHELLSMIGGYDPKRGAKVAGHRGYFLTGPGMMLNMALYNYALSFLVGGNGYLPIQPPFFLKSDIMAETCQLDDFDENLYRVDTGKGPKTDDKKAGKADLLIQEKKVPTDEPQHEDDDKFLIATSEQPLSAYYRGEYLAPDQLPVRFAGFSTCFRKEAGSHGKDCWGLYRVHQFEKVEQFLVTHPDESWAEFTKMMNISKEFYKSLQLPYRVVNIVSGALNDAAAKKQDLEAWFPGYNEYRELVSCSNCTDYQSRNLEVRLRAQKVKGQVSFIHLKNNQPETKAYVHMLNGTLCATGRTLCCLLENYQTPEGIRVPEPLVFLF